MMFGRKKAPKPDQTDTVIGKGTTIEGDISSKASLRIEGVVRGDIHCAGDVIVGDHAEIHSDIHARNVTVAGSVHGTISTKDALTITSRGKVFGSISVKLLKIVEGGIFEGVSRMEIKQVANLAAEDRKKELPGKSAVHKNEKTSVAN
jgi:cytoskeletal protein CcmA (bactofilin family)